MLINESSKIAVIGDSHSRTFAHHSCFLPLFIGSGKSNCFISDELAEITTNKIICNLERLSFFKNVMLVFGEPDVRLYCENYNMIKSKYSLSDRDFILSCFRRYQKTLLKIQDIFNYKLIVFNVAPSPRQDQNELATYYNTLLKEFCIKKNIVFIDIWSSITGSDGKVIPKYSAEHVHLNDLVVPRIINKLKGRQLIHPSIPAVRDFGWSFRYRFLVSNEYLTQIWGDSRHNKKQKKFFVSDMVRFYAGYIKAIAKITYIIKKKLKIAVYGCKEGFVPFEFTKMKNSNITAFEADQSKLEFAIILHKFMNVDNISFLSFVCELMNDYTDKYDINILFSIENTKEIEKDYLISISQKPFKTLFFISSDTSFEALHVNYLKGKAKLYFSFDIFKNFKKMHCFFNSKPNYLVAYLIFKNLAFIYFLKRKILKTNWAYFSRLFRHNSTI